MSEKNIPTTEEKRSAELTMDDAQWEASEERENTFNAGRVTVLNGSEVDSAIEHNTTFENSPEKTPMEDALIYILAKMPSARPEEWPYDYVEVLDQMGIEGNWQQMFESLKHLDDLGIIVFKGGDTPPRMGEDQSDGQQINDSLNHLAKLGIIRLED